MPLQTGQVLNQRYRIIRLLGQGGFGAVYLAWDLNLNAHVAVKESLETSPAAERQFRSEAGLLFKLHHTNLPRVHDCFTVPGQGLYLTMDYIDGESLERKLARQAGALPVDAVLAWMGPVCDALDYLHRQQPAVIHRDIKPSNIVIRADGCPFLVDFGISKLFDPNRKTTLAAQALTPGYSPPEQYGQAATDGRSDLYALGATLYHLLTGQAPPPAMDIASGVVPPLRPPQSLNPAVPPSVGQAVMRAMQINRDQRWSSAAAFKQALLACAVSLAPQPAAPLAPGKVAPTLVVAPPPPAPVQSTTPLQSWGSAAVERPRRRPWMPGLLGLVGAAGVLGLCLALSGLWTGWNFLRPTSPAAWVTLDPPTAQPTHLPVAASPAVLAVQPTNTLHPPATDTPLPTNTPRPTAVSSPTPVSDLPPANPQAGAAWTRPADGMVMVFIPAGEFWMGSSNSDPEADKNEKPQHKVDLDDYWIDRTEVTYAMFRRFVSASGYSWENAYEGQDDYPVTSVPWSGASAYCRWTGGSLPSEAQWEKAARGPLVSGQEPRRYPWGDQEPTCSLAQIYTCSDHRVQPAGSRPGNASFYGVLDLADNVSEWVQDWYEMLYYQHSPGRNPSGAESGWIRVVRGCSSGCATSLFRVSYRGHIGPQYANGSVGFRCVR